MARAIHAHFMVMFPSLAMFIALIKREWQIMPHRVVPILNILMIFVPLMHKNGSDMIYILKMVFKYRGQLMILVYKVPSSMNVSGGP